MKIRSVVLWGVVSCGLVALAAAWSYGNIMTGRTASEGDPHPVGAQVVHLTSTDGIALVGSFWPGKSETAPGVLLLHGQGSSRAQFDSEGEVLSDQGYAVLAIDLRGHGNSAGNTRSIGYFEGRDAHAAMAWLRAHQHGAKTAIIGDSLGGAAALLGEAGPTPADAYVLTVMYPDIRRAIGNRLKETLGSALGTIGEPLLSYQARIRFGVWPEDMSPIKAITKVHAPVFIIGGALDRYTPPDETRAIYAAANQPKQLWVVPGGTHDGATDSPEYEQRILAFLDHALK